MPESTPIAFTDDEIAAVAWNADGLATAIVQEEATGEVLMLGYMNSEALERTILTREAHS